MQINQLVLENIGQFRNRVDFDLRPRILEQKEYPIILFGGKNGAGKTTLLQSIQLCLYGHLSIGNKVAKSEYESFIDSLIHNPKGVCEPPQSAFIELEFTYTHTGEFSTFRIKREWQRNEQSITERLKVHKNGTLLDNLSSEQWQEFIHSIIPLPLSSLFFFDGEKIKNLADTTGLDGLSTAIKDLLGLDLVTQLEADLNYIKSEDSKAKLSSDILKDISSLEKEIKEKEDEIQGKVEEKSNQEVRKIRIEEKLQQLETELSGKGGSFAKMREKNIKNFESLKSKIELKYDQLKELAEDSLSFCLVPGLMGQISDQLETEKKFLEQSTLKQFFKENFYSVLEKSIDSDLLKEFGIKLSEKDILRFSKQLATGLEDSVSNQWSKDKCNLLHEFSAEQIQRFYEVKNRIENEVPQKIKKLSEDIQQKEEKAAKIQEKILKAPDEGSIQTYIEQIKSKQNELTICKTKISKLEEKIRSLEFSKVEQERELKNLIQQKSAGRSLNNKMNLIKSVQRVLNRYQGELKKEKIHLLEKELVYCWQKLTHKKDFVNEIKIDNDTFDVMLINSKKHTISKEKLSSGEKQMYAVSILWALARISGRPLPVIVDTPLGRLDSDHRTKLVESYFPEASHQVLILSTDTEIDKKYYKKLEPSISHAYYLKFDESSQSTKVTNGYFWQTEVAS